MCLGLNTQDKNSKRQVLHQSDNTNQANIPQDIPEHCDNPLLNRNLKNGALGFRYENKKDGMTVVYSSAEAKTFCMLMRISPLKK